MAFSQHRMEAIQSMTGGAHGLVKLKKARVSSAVATTETDTGIVLPEKCLVLDAFIDVITVDTGETVDIGTSGDASDDPDGFLDGVSLTTAGVVTGKATVTTGSSEKYFSSTTRGVLLQYFTAGSDVATDVGTVDNFADPTSGGEAVSYTASAAGAAFDVYVMYIEL